MSTPSPIPTLQSPRLTLRAHLPTDFEACAAIWGDPAVVTHIGGRPFTREEVWTRLLRCAGLWPMLGYGYWAVVERSTGQYIGDIGFADFRRAISPPLDAPEMGWVLAAAAHGRGFATEAVGAALAWIDHALHRPRTVCIIAPGNTPSMRVAEKCGFRETRRATYHDRETVVFERPGA